jgi:NAD(P)H-dependent FMN reductase
MTANTSVFIPVLLGTIRRGRASEAVARFVHSEIAKREGVETTLVDIRELNITFEDEGESIKDSWFSELIARADGLALVVPEYNHGYPGSLKHVLDTNLKEYIHKAVGVCGVSAGPFGGARVIQSILPVLRELGLVTTFSDGNFSSAHKLFDEQGVLLEQAYIRRIDPFIKELIWMSRVLKNGREHFPQE